MYVALILLIFAIICEVFASSLLKITDGFKRVVPSIGVILGYGLAFYVLSLSLKTLPLGMAYAIWAGVGTALTAMVGVIIYKEVFNRKKFWGIVFIITGAVFLNMANS